ncbi:MAG TPA: cytochrome c oxidase subunit II [Solirubrobacterales bacterium]|nr:cytochrome c oxidase subunit II [Solirubrobacterales bacterium]
MIPLKGLAPLAHAEDPSHAVSLLGGKGDNAEILGREITFQLIAGGAVFLLVIGILLAIVVRQRRRPAGGEPPPEDERGHGWIWLGGIAMPLIVISAVAAFGAVSIHQLARGDAGKPLVVDVTAQRWFWQTTYEGDEDVTTANEVVVPVGRPVLLRLETRDVIHSFWVPELAQKVDVIPGRRNTLRLTASEPGTYFGRCMEFCGIQHTNMRFEVRVLPKPGFDDWLRHAEGPAPPPATAAARRGEQVFLGSTCSACHAIEGTPARGSVGPELTHLASRDMIAAGTVPNTRANLAGWVSDPHGIKPGVLMPEAELSGQQLQDLLDYLDGLR